jgi:hypothetical protein
LIDIGLLQNSFGLHKQMPDPMGGKRLLDYDCHVSYQKSFLVKPKEIRNPDDFRTGTKKGKLIREPIWIVEIKMPKNLLTEIYSASLENLDIKEIEAETAPVQSTPAEQPGPAPGGNVTGSAPAQPATQGGMDSVGATL